jgi:hypothetical protein
MFCRSAAIVWRSTRSGTSVEEAGASRVVSESAVSVPGELIRVRTSVLFVCTEEGQGPLLEASAYILLSRLVKRALMPFRND